MMRHVFLLRRYQPNTEINLSLQKPVGSHTETETAPVSDMACKGQQYVPGGINKAPNLTIRSTAGADVRRFAERLSRAKIGLGRSSAGKRQVQQDNLYVCALER